MIYSRTQQGYTLLEVMTVTALLAITLSFAVPAGTQMLESSQRHATVSSLITGLNLARNSAIQEQTLITFCPLDIQDKCSHDWSGAITLFRDPKKLRKLSDAAQVIRIFSPPERGRLIVNSANRPYFSWSPDGMAWYAMGNIIWCPNDDDASKAAQLRINMGGRPQTAKDRDGDGVVEDAYGKPVKCKS